LVSIEIIPIAGTDIRFVPGEWPLPAEMRAEVAQVWRRLKADKPHIWDGRILGFTQPVIGADGILRAEAREDAYSAFLTWRQAGFPDVGVVHIFGTALIVSSDNALILGRMGGDTINAGRVYPPGGSLEPRDVRADGSVDVDFCIRTELREETGLCAEEAVQGKLLAIFEGQRLSIARVYRFAETADDLLQIIRANMDAQEERELADVVACRSADDGRAAGALAAYAAHLLDAISAGRLQFEY
jgi:8-oxo-dGTP pyrophosphatase MutT (NUDIX family)